MFQLDVGDFASHDRSPPGAAGGEEEPAAPTRSAIGVARKLGRGSLGEQLYGVGPALEGGGDDEHEGIETEGEGQADRVEAAVAQGKSARSVLGGGHGGEHEGGEHEGHEGGEHEGEHGAHPAASSAGHAPARKQKPALKDGPAFGTGMAFSTGGFEKSVHYNIWDHKPFEIHTPVPGLNVLVGPKVWVKASGDVNWHKKQVAAHLGVYGAGGIL